MEEEEYLIMTGDAIELRDYIRGLWKQKWVIGLFLIVSVAIAVSISFSLPRQYVTETALLISPPLAHGLLVDSEVVQVPFSAAAYKTMALADDLLLSVIQGLDLRAGSELTAVESLKRLMKIEVARAADVTQDGSTLVLLVMRVSGKSPARISEIANKWSELFVEQNTKLLQNASTASYDFIAERLQELSTNLEATKSRRQDYAEQNTLELWESKLTVMRDVYEDFAGKLQDNKLAMVEKQAEVKSLEAAVLAEPHYLEEERSVPDELLWELLNRSPSLEDLVALEELSLIEQKNNELYLSLKDQLIQAKTELNALEEGTRYLEIRVQQLESQIAEKIARIEDIKAELEKMDREIEAIQSIYSRLFEKLQEARVSKAESPSSIQVVESAVIPQVPTGPNRWLYVCLAAVLGLLLGVIAASFRWYMAAGSKDESERHID